MNIDWNERHKDLVVGLTKPGEDIVKSLNANPEQANLWHMATGVAGEAGELLDAVKKHVVYGKTLDLENVIEELGDLEFYMAGVRAHIGISREKCIRHNIEKLSVRYGSGTYSDAQAAERADKQP